METNAGFFPKKAASKGKIYGRKNLEISPLPGKGYIFIIIQEKEKYSGKIFIATSISAPVRIVFMRILYPAAGLISI
jgi:hypothetical protein